MAERPPDLKFRLGVAFVALLAMLAGVVMTASAGQTGGAVVGLVITVACALWVARLYFRDDERDAASQVGSTTSSSRLGQRMEHQALWVTICLLLAFVGGPLLVRLLDMPRGAGAILVIGLLVVLAILLGYAERRAKKR
ncbi:MAG: hypothetical protein PGN15_14025 [Aeromicrobium erythreum]